MKRLLQIIFSIPLGLPVGDEKLMKCFLSEEGGHYFLSEVEPIKRSRPKGSKNKMKFKEGDVVRYKKTGGIHTVDLIGSSIDNRAISVVGSPFWYTEDEFEMWEPNKPNKKKAEKVAKETGLKLGWVGEGVLPDNIKARKVLTIKIYSDGSSNTRFIEMVDGIWFVGVLTHMANCVSAGKASEI